MVLVLLKALAKSNGNLLLSPLRVRKSNNFRKRAIIKRSKELRPKRMQTGLRVITLQGAKKKSPLLLSQY
jgi:hypothetical protein